MQTARSTPWKFVFATDLHIGTGRSFRFRPNLNENWETARKQILDLNPELLVVGGDMTRDGLIHRFELEQARDSLDSLPFPYKVLPGNHDVGTRYHPDAPTPVSSRSVQLYRSVFGPDNWTFLHGNVQFSTINAFLTGSNLPEEEEMWEFMDGLERFPEADHHVWVLHLLPCMHSLDEPDWDLSTDRKNWYRTIPQPHRNRILEAMKRTSADLLLTGHVHCRHHHDFDGIRWIAGPATAWGTAIPEWEGSDSTQGFLVFEVTPGKLTPEFVALEKLSTTEGYGLTGNPRPEERDYSLAWEKPPLDPEEQAYPAK